MEQNKKQSALTKQIELKPLSQSTKDKFKKFTHNKWVIIVLLVLIMAGSLTRIIYTFTQREGFHSDESWSYGFANSYYEPYVFSDASQTKIHNYYKWISGSVLNDYITVQNGQRFRYLSVLYNQKNDMSPPLHSLILHTICSFFPDSFSWWYSFSINIAAFFLCMSFLYLLGKKIFKSSWGGILLVAFYGFTTGALNTFVYLRMYALLTAFSVILTYLHYIMYEKKFIKIKKELIWSGVITFLGCFTHYYFFILAFCFALFTVIYLAVKKNMKKFFQYGLTELAGAGMIFAVYPSAFDILKGSTSHYHQTLSMWFRYKFCWMILSKEVTGWQNIWSFVAFLIPFACVVAVIAVIAAVLKHKPKSENTEKNNKKSAGEKIKSFFKTLFTHFDPFSVMLFVSVFATVALISKISFIGGMNVLLDRYMFFVMPLLCTLIMYVIYRIMIKFNVKTFRQAVILAAAAAIMLAYNNSNSSCNYMFYRYTDSPQTVQSISENSNMIVVTDEYWHLTCYSSTLNKCYKFYALDNSLSDNINNTLFKGFDKTRKTYIILPLTYYYSNEKSEYNTENKH